MNVLVVKASQVWHAQSYAPAIARAVTNRDDMHLIEGNADDKSGCVAAAEVETILQSLDPETCCAVVLAGHSAETKDLVQRWLSLRSDLAIMHVELVDHRVRITLRAPNLDSLNLD